MIIGGNRLSRVSKGITPRPVNFNEAAKWRRAYGGYANEAQHASSLAKSGGMETHYDAMKAHAKAAVVAERAGLNGRSTTHRQFEHAHLQKMQQMLDTDTARLAYFEKSASSFVRMGKSLTPSAMMERLRKALQERFAANGEAEVWVRELLTKTDDMTVDFCVWQKPDDNGEYDEVLKTLGFSVAKTGKITLADADLVEVNAEV